MVPQSQHIGYNKSLSRKMPSARLAERELSVGSARRAGSLSCGNSLKRFNFRKKILNSRNKERVDGTQTKNNR